ncbi:hypothetical protein PQQ99_38580, partial [Paraburkholderia sediminicola]|uniref:hypothetical protein n=1 Tax=Paraburkholderia sediminicola TaxID=458836 RepID=UPI0038B6E5C0
QRVELSQSHQAESGQFETFIRLSKIVVNYARFQMFYWARSRRSVLVPETGSQTLEYSCPNLARIICWFPLELGHAPRP